jgi:hypothetical protein
MGSKQGSGGRRWTVGGRRWAVDSRWLVVDSRRLVVGGRRSAVGGRRLVVDSRRDDRALGIHNSLPTAHCPPPTADHRPPTAHRLLPTAYLFSTLVIITSLLYASPVIGDDSPAERRERIESMTAAEKEQLLRRQEQFESLAPSKQERIKKLHEELQQAPELQQVMHRYHEWLDSLPSYQRAQLLELAPAERIKRIKEIRTEQALANAWRPSPVDLEAISRWQDEYAAKYEAQLVGRLKDDQRQPWEKLDPVRRRAHIKWLMLQLSDRGRLPRPPGPGPAPGEKLRPDERKLPAIGDAELKVLRENLSPEARKRLEAVPSGEQWATIGGWVRQEMRRQWQGMRQRGPGAGPGPGPRPPVDDEHLADFFERELSAADRDRLLELPSEEMQRELRQMYLARYQLIAPPVWPPDGSQPWQRGKRPGPPGGERGGSRKTDKTGPPRFDKPPRPEPPPKEPPE